MLYVNNANCYVRAKIRFGWQFRYNQFDKSSSSLLPSEVTRIDTHTPFQNLQDGRKQWERERDSKKEKMNEKYRRFPNPRSTL